MKVANELQFVMTTLHRKILQKAKERERERGREKKREKISSKIVYDKILFFWTGKLLNLERKKWRVGKEKKSDLNFHLAGRKKIIFFFTFFLYLFFIPLMCLNLSLKWTGKNRWSRFSDEWIRSQFFFSTPFMQNRKFSFTEETSRRYSGMRTSRLCF